MSRLPHLLDNLLILTNVIRGFPRYFEENHKIVHLIMPMPYPFVSFRLGCHPDI
jgi:hypothetical protein